jgi:hypothetical protein
MGLKERWIVQEITGQRRRTRTSVEARTCSVALVGAADGAADGWGRHGETPRAEDTYVRRRGDAFWADAVRPLRLPGLKQSSIVTTFLIPSIARNVS